jgi:redox-sensitive bicupin YhaK (pirin superfamily)
MMTIRRASERGQANHGWLKSYFTFSFADYHEPRFRGFRSLRVINDDTVLPGGGFDMHPHRDMEIITVVLSGALEHKDSMGNGRIIRPGEVQYMAAGTGILHSEFNPSPSEPVHLLQIWILPDKKGAPPAYAEKSFQQAPAGRLNLIASKSGRDGSIPINQDADLFIVKFSGGETVAHSLRANRHAWLHVAEGELQINGQPLAAGDGVAVSDEKNFQLTASKPAQALLFDLN